ncbi:hypothetical protein [Hymenobacter sp. APR13]|uniref:hypothetical protein n=1 Tax=Hymenobacter sp. APR13 TaxID=1356852 RepID=UPI0004E048C4|nr:hypothetical protein [Hymenobacter sp. APR13]AII51730.1 hypothetical protein N008_06995 [Hymenobacter sp. APR13]
MKPALLLFLMILALATVAQLFLPWWVITPLCMGLAFFSAATPGPAFGTGFLGIGLGWLGLAGWLSLQNHHILAQRVAQLLPLGGSAGALLLVTAIVGGLVGGLAALAGSWARQAVRPRPIA